MQSAGYAVIHQSESSDGLVWLVPYLGPSGRSDHDVLDAELQAGGTPESAMDVYGAPIQRTSSGP